MNLEQLVRKNIAYLQPYSSARSEFKGNASVFLDANENPLNGPYNRYPDPLQWKLKEKIANIKNIDVNQIFLGNGSDEPIDLVFRIFCEPKQDNVVAIDPTYGMYQVCANINDVEYRKVLLSTDYTMDADKLLAATDKNTKIVFLCSPNNPTGNLLDKDQILRVLTEFKGIVILDEAYIDFSLKDSLLPELNQYPNLIILQTLSKAWGLAAIRLGMAFASAEIIGYFNKIKYPYNLNQLTQEFVYNELDNESQKDGWVSLLRQQREFLNNRLSQNPLVEKIYHSDANFILIKVPDANSIYNTLVEKGIIVRNRNSVSLCGNCLRITIGTAIENKELIEALKEINITK